MELKIGNKIKSLRKKRQVTQEQLAEKIGVSFQAVSKWENNVALPDITLIPVLANYFGVSTDEILSYDSFEKDREIMDYARRSQQYRERFFWKYFATSASATTVNCVSQPSGKPSTKIISAPFSFKAVNCANNVFGRYFA